MAVMVTRVGLRCCNTGDALWGLNGAAVSAELEAGAGTRAAAGARKSEAAKAARAGVPAGQAGRAAAGPAGTLRSRRRAHSTMGARARFSARRPPT